VGPLNGIKVLEFSGIGLGPFCCMMLADMGAEVVSIQRKKRPEVGFSGVLNRGRCSVCLDLKVAEDVGIALRLVEHADALVEGFRPGVMERLKLGPDDCLARNPRLIYARVTGWGQTGPLRNAAGHNINYIALTGALHAIGAANQKPVVPLNLLGDFAGGGLLSAFAVVCGILEARKSGRGQVIDVAMVDGTALLMGMIFDFTARGQWTSERGTNLLDGGVADYNTYECADGKYIAIGSLESEFYALLRSKLGLDGEADHDMRLLYSPLREQKFAAIFKTRTRAQWCELLEGTDACFAPVLDLDEAPRHAHNLARQTFIDIDGTLQPAPAPKFSRTPGHVRPKPTRAEIGSVLSNWGLTPSESDKAVQHSST